MNDFKLAPLFAPSRSILIRSPFFYFCRSLTRSFFYASEMNILMVVRGHSQTDMRTYLSRISLAQTVTYLKWSRCSLRIRVM